MARRAYCEKFIFDTAADFNIEVAELLDMIKMSPRETANKRFYRIVTMRLRPLESYNQTPHHSYEAVAQVEGISATRVRQIMAKVIKKLKEQHDSIRAQQESIKAAINDYR